MTTELALFWMGAAGGAELLLLVSLLLGIRDDHRNANTPGGK